VKTAAAIILAGLVGGCASGGSAKWFAPATWFSGKPAADVDRAAKQETAAREAVIKSAQKASHETSLALSLAPASRPVAVAADSNASAVALLDQAAGPLDAATLARIRAVITGLLSDNAQLRETAERQREKERRTTEEVSGALTKAEEKSEQAATKLRAAFERENALANELRSQRALIWIAGGVAVLCAAGWIYVKFFLGGIPAALAMAKRDIEREHPEVAKTIAPFYARYLDKRHQLAIRKST